MKSVNSIRNILLVWMLPGFILVYIFAAVGLYHAEKVSLETKLNNKLTVLASRIRPNGDFGQFKLSHKRGRGIERGDVDEHNIYVQQWNAKGVSYYKSNNLAQADLRFPGKLNRRTTHYYDQVAGKQVFVKAISFNGPRGSIVAFAIATGEFEERLNALTRRLLIGGVISTGVFAILLGFALRFALSALKNMSQQTERLNADSLDYRFNLTELPHELKPLASRLNDLITRLQQSFQRERQFSNDLAHELRTPLAGIRTTAEVAAKWPDPEPKNDFISIANTAEQMQQTVERLLMLARLENQLEQKHLQSCMLNELVNENVELWLNKAEMKQLSFEQQFNQSIVLDADPVILQMLLSNIIGNAVEYAPAASQIKLTISEEKLTIANFAPMLQQEDLVHLFERLWRAEKSRHDNAHAGLGLSIAKRCAELLNLSLIAELDEQQWLNMHIYFKV